MALEIAFYKVTEDIAIRSGLIEVRYRTDDVHWILDNKDLSRIRFSIEEYISGLKGIERIDEKDVETLIARGGYKMGYDGLDPDWNKEDEQGQELEPTVEEEIIENNDDNTETVEEPTTEEENENNESQETDEQIEQETKEEE